MHRALTTFGLFLAACGGPEPAATADDVETPMEADTESAGDDANDGAAAGSVGEEEGPAEGGDMVTPEELQAVLQLTLDDEALAPYLKLEEPGRFPLKVSGDIPGGIELTKATEPVKIVPEPGDKKEAVLVITEVSVSGNHARVRYRYDIEGVRGSATLEKVEGRWSLKSSRLTEY